MTLFISPGAVSICYQTRRIQVREEALWEVRLHCHGQGPFLGVVAGERHPCHIQRMREGAEGLSPDDSEVANSAEVDLGEDAIEHVAEEMHTHSGYHRLPALVTVLGLDTRCDRCRNLAGRDLQVIGHVTKRPRHRDL